ncbi:hypothetical protein [uncultured Gulosibacter sp.]|uniref:hypothetical protein n=1 Tax=uncultured Gulosibacter sp. TaxID=1339167 RepID=UPI00288AAB28|nr:hypothetical protein [uncultured Gulosibacter sp.]
MFMQTPNLIVERRDEILPNAEGVLGTLNGVVGQVQGWVSQGVKIVESIFGPNPITSLLSKIIDAVNKFLEIVNKLRKLVEKLVEVMRGILMPWLLPSYAKRWYSISDNYQQAATGIGPQGLRAPGNTDWTGQAAVQYQKVAATYSEAASFGSETAKAQGERLDELAEKGQAYYISIGGLIVSVITTVVAVATATGTIVGIPAAVVEAALALPGLLAAFASAIQSTYDLASTMASEMNQIMSAITSAQQYFPGGAWLPLAQVG